MSSKCGIDEPVMNCRKKQLRATLIDNFLAPNTQFPPVAVFMHGAIIPLTSNRAKVTHIRRHTSEVVATVPHNVYLIHFFVLNMNYKCSVEHLSNLARNELIDPLSWINPAPEVEHDMPDMAEDTTLFAAAHLYLPGQTIYNSGLSPDENESRDKTMCTVGECAALPARFYPRNYVTMGRLLTQISKRGRGPHLVYVVNCAPLPSPIDFQSEPEALSLIMSARKHYHQSGIEEWHALLKQVREHKDAVLFRRFFRSRSALHTIDFHKKFSDLLEIRIQKVLIDRNLTWEKGGLDDEDIQNIYDFRRFPIHDIEPIFTAALITPENQLSPDEVVVRDFMKAEGAAKQQKLKEMLKVFRMSTPPPDHISKEEIRFQSKWAKPRSILRSTEFLRRLRHSGRYERSYHVDSAKLGRLFIKGTRLLRKKHGYDVDTLDPCLESAECPRHIANTSKYCDTIFRKRTRCRRND